MKKLIYAAVGLAVVFATSCKKDVASDDQKPLIIGATVDTLVGDILVATTVTRETYLKGIVYVRPGVTLTVNAGVTIKGSPGGTLPDIVNLENNKGTLVVEKGGILIANGTQTNPIVWTSSNPAGSRNFGDWGGIVILGQAPILTASGAASNTFEAFTALTNGRNTYGGNLPGDNSGSITYNRVDFGGGIVAAQNREVNGFTLCGVGNGTIFHHNEVTNCGDDGFEFFGGTINVDHLISYSNKDDDFDFDEAYNGKLQFIIAYRTDLADNSGSEMIESDNNSAGADWGQNTTPFIANATLIGPSSLTVRSGVTGTFDGGIYVRRNSRIILANSIVSGQVLPSVVASTSTTDASFLLPTLDPNASPVVYNIFESQSSTPVVLAPDANPVGTVVNTPLFNYLSLAANANSSVPNYAGFKLDGTLKPLAGSPALSGGFNLSSYGFVGTTQRGAVLTTDVWTAQPWITTALN